MAAWQSVLQSNDDKIMYVDVVASLYERRQIIETVFEAFLSYDCWWGILCEDIQKALNRVPIK